MKYQKWQFMVIPNKDIIKGKNPALQCIYMWICSYANENWECFPSINKLEQDCDCSKNTVLKYIKDLVELWILVKENRFKNNEQISNLYNIIIVDKITECNSWTGGSATDELPSATVELGGSATDEHRTKSNSWTKSINEISSKEDTAIAEYWNKEVNEIISILKEKVKECELIYSSDPQDRQYAKHLLSKKFSANLLQFWMTMEEFIGNIVKLSTQPYTKQVNNCKKFYYNRWDVINSSKSWMNKNKTTISHIW